MKATEALLDTLRDITNRLRVLAEEDTRHELDLDAVADLNLARQSVDKLINRVERLVPDQR
jgi:hypothetical protein